MAFLGCKRQSKGGSFAHLLLGLKVHKEEGRERGAWLAGGGSLHRGVPLEFATTQCFAPIFTNAQRALCLIFILRAFRMPWCLYFSSELATPPLDPIINKTRIVTFEPKTATLSPQ